MPKIPLGLLGGVLEQTLRAIKTVKVAGAESRQEQQLLDHAAQSRDESVKALRREALVWTIASTGIQGAIILILGIGAWRVSLGEMTVATLVAFLLYAFGLLGPVSEISQSLTTLQAGMAAAGRIREIEDIDFERTAKEDNPSSPVVNTVSNTTPIAALDNVTARYSPGNSRCSTVCPLRYLRRDTPRLLARKVRVRPVSFRCCLISYNRKLVHCI